MLVLSALCAPASSASPVPSAPGPTVAVLEVEAPAPSFLLHGTLPVPPHTFPRADGRSPFALVDESGVTFAAQTETVSRYPSAARGADVVEVLAQVVLPPGRAPGELMRYRVILAPHDETPFVLSPAVAGLVNTPGAVTLLARDVFGNAYAADLLTDLRENTSQLRVRRCGGALRTTSGFEVMMPAPPVEGAAGTLPHLFSVHAHSSIESGRAFLGLDLEISNGGSGHDPADEGDDALGDVYFEQLVLRVPAAWRVRHAFDDPYVGEEWVQGGWRYHPIVARLPGDALHLMPSQARMLRRLALYLPEEEPAARAALSCGGLAFCRRGTLPDGRELWSWWNPRTARWFGEAVPMPALEYLGIDGLLAGIRQDLADVRAALAAGTPGPWPIVSGALGWAHPWGIEIGYMHGGTEIHLTDGVRTAATASVEGYRLWQIRQRMVASRHPIALYDGNGRPTHLEEWLVDGPHGPYNPTWLFLTPLLFLGDPWGITTSPSFQRDAVRSQGRQPSYEPALQAFEPIDVPHLVRATAAPKVLAWLGNDPLAKDELHLTAELLRMTYAPYPNDGWGYVAPTTMLSDELFVASHPHQGFDVNRYEGWLFDTIAAAYALADDSFRGRFRPWIEQFVAIVRDGQDACTGVIGTAPNWEQLGGRYRLRQSISEAILENGLAGLRSHALGHASPEHSAAIDEILAHSAEAAILPAYWNAASRRAWFWAATGPYDTDLPGYCGDVPDEAKIYTDNYQVWSTLARGFRLTADPTFLHRAEEMAEGDVAGVPWFGEGYLENAASTIELFQELGLVPTGEAPALQAGQPTRRPRRDRTAVGGE